MLRDYKIGGEHMADSSRLKDVDPNSLESLFDVVITRKHGVREGWLMAGEFPLCIVLTSDMTKKEAEEMIQLAYSAVEPANTLPI